MFVIFSCHFKIILNENISKDGIVLLSVPAWNWLYTAHDRNLGHFRRYSPTNAREILEKCGFEIICSGGLFHSLLLVRILSKIKEIWSKQSVRKNDFDEDLGNLGNWDKNSLLTSFIDFALWCDNFVSIVFYNLNVQLPGLSYWAIAKKS